MESKLLGIDCDGHLDLIKKAEEEKILKKIYNDKKKKRYKVRQSEKPDFIINDLKSNKKFGVEITQMYYSQSSYKLKEKEIYILDALKNGIPRRDQEEISVHKIYIDINGKWNYIGDTIGQHFKSYDDYVDKLVEIIREKSAKARRYVDLDYLELFIEDKERYLFFRKVEELQYLENSEKMKKAINDMPFIRVYFFTVINQKDFLLLMGDCESSPLNISNNDIERHKEYMESLYSKAN